MDNKVSLLEARIQHIENELAEVKRELRSLNKLEENSPEPLKVKNTASSEYSSIPKQEKERLNLEQVISDWLPRVFIFVFILGIIWGFIAAIDKGWISPAVRVLTGLGLAGFLYWAGNRQYKKTRNPLSIVLLGGSIIVYIAAVFAGNVLYEIIPYFLTLAMLAAGLVVGVWMSRKYKSETLLAVIGIGAYLYPFLFAGDKGTENLFYFYETLIFAGLVLESIQKQYKVTWNIANYAFIFAVLFFTVTGAGVTTLITFLVLVLQQLVIIYLTFQFHHAASKEMYIPAISIGAFFLYLIGEDVFGPISANLYLFYVLTAAVYGGLSLVRSKNHHELKNVFFVFSMFYLFVLVSRIFNEEIFTRLIIYTAQAAVIFYLAQKRKSIFGTLAGLILLLPVLAELSDLPGYQLTYAAVICWLLVIGFFLAVYLYREKTTVVSTAFIKKVSPYLIGLVILAFLSKLSELATYQQSIMYNDIGLSISWMFFVALMYAAYAFFKEKQWQYIGLSFLFITLGKLILYDLTTVDIVWRAVLFIILGATGLFISRIFYNRSDQKG